MHLNAKSKPNQNMCSEKFYQKNGLKSRYNFCIGYSDNQSGFSVEDGHCPVSQCFIVQFCCSIFSVFRYATIPDFTRRAEDGGSNGSCLVCQRFVHELKCDCVEVNNTSLMLIISFTFGTKGTSKQNLFV